MRGRLIFESVYALIDECKTRDPFLLIAQLKIKLVERSDYPNLKGYAITTNGQSYIMINSNLDRHTKRLVAAHELGHIILHQAELASAGALFDHSLYDAESKTEYEANIFAADLLITDDEVISACNDTTPDIFSMAKALETRPELLNIKISGMQKRGYDIQAPLTNNSLFLKKRSIHRS